ncbi:hypothetical protein [Clostridium rectalis]|uniref:hypothetical protein n=1 Tax=Clostridium rectalis TaxID=2040295 RepID=UPI000F6448AA|nr:hypothetical protein [Clostridium rectalis]
MNMLQQNQKRELKRILQRIETEIEVRRLNNDKCPKCNEELIVLTEKDCEMLEHFGTECRQLISIRKCPNCGWKYDD